MLRAECFDCLFFFPNSDFRRALQFRLLFVVRCEPSGGLHIALYELRIAKCEMRSVKCDLSTAAYTGNTVHQSGAARRRLFL